MLAREHAAQLGRLETHAQILDALRGLVGRLGVLGLERQLEQDPGVGEPTVGLVEERHLALERSLLAQHQLGGVSVVREGGRRRALL